MARNHIYKVFHLSICHTYIYLVWISFFYFSVKSSSAFKFYYKDLSILSKLVILLRIKSATNDNQDFEF